MLTDQTWLKLVFTGFSIVIFLLQRVYLYSLEESHCAHPILRDGQLHSTCLRVDYLHKIFEILWEELSLLSHLLIDLSVLFISVWTPDTNFALYAISEFHFIDFVAQNFYLWSLWATWLLCLWYTTITVCFLRIISFFLYPKLFFFLFICAYKV
jgi:hypothetical protein